MSDESLNERESQLSAMFDGELPAAECELLARRLTRDELLRSQWSRFSMIGAALRAERGVALHDRVAWKVQATLTQEVTYGDGTIDIAASSVRTAALVPSGTSQAFTRSRWARFARPAAGASIAAGVAAMSIFWLRTQDTPEPMVASNAAPQTIVLTPDTSAATVALNSPVAATRPISNGEPDRYVTPAPTSSSSIAPPARLANYVVAHSEYSGPLSRRMALLGLVATDASEVGTPIDPPADNSVGAPDAP